MSDLIKTDYLEALFELIRISLVGGNLTRVLKKNEWAELYDLSCKLGVNTFVYDGLQRLSNIDIDEELYYKWIGQGLVKENEFSRHVEIIREFTSRCNALGVKIFVLKGLAFGINYPVPVHRSCGDIDIFCVSDDGMPAYLVGNEVASQLGAEVSTHWYKHSKIHYKGVPIENHEYLICTREGKMYKELNRKLKELLLSDKCERQLYDTGALIPSTYFNALFQAYHSRAHFLSDGIGLRHVLDWATFLQKEQSNLDWALFYADCERFHLKRFIVAMTDIAVNRFGIKINNPIIETDSPHAGKLLDSILYDDSKVLGTPGGAWNHRVRLIGNVVKYRWKYIEIAQESYAKHIISTIWGFFFHTED